MTRIQLGREYLEYLQGLFRSLRHPRLRGIFLLAVLACPSLLSREAFAEPVEFTVDHGRSYIAVKTDKEGLLSAFGAGHNHGIVATKWSANVCFDPQNVSASRIAVAISTASLRIDTAEAREKAGLDPEGPNANDVQKIQEKMLASQNLSAEEYPDIEFQSTSVESTNQRSFLVRGSLTIRGKPQTVSLLVSFERLDGQIYHFSGQFPVRQSSYGIKPESVGGVVNVKDEVTVHIGLYGSLTSKACE